MVWYVDNDAQANNLTVTVTPTDKKCMRDTASLDEFLKQQAFLFGDTAGSYKAAQRVQEDREVLMFCDFHGHYRERNIFVYDCESKERDGGFYLGIPPYLIMKKVFPKILSNTAPDLFSMAESSFKVQKFKESTHGVLAGVGPH